MATRGNVYVRPGLHVTALRTGGGEHKLEVSVGGEVDANGVSLNALEVRDMHRELGVWLDAVAQPEPTPRVTVINATEPPCALGASWWCTCRSGSHGAS